MNWLLNKLVTWHTKQHLKNVREYSYAGLTPSGGYISGTLTVTGDMAIKTIIADARKELNGGPLTALSRL